MSLIFESHGEFKLYVSNNILIARLVGSWNRECAQSFSENFKLVATPLIGKRWGHLVLLDEWQVSAAEISPIITDLVTWCIENGLEKSAQVYRESMVKKHSLDKMVIDHKGRFERQSFIETSAALRWLTQHGFKVEQGVIAESVV